MLNNAINEFHFQEAMIFLKEKNKATRTERDEINSKRTLFISQS